MGESPDRTGGMFQVQTKVFS